MPQAVIEADPDAWTADPTAVVTTLREPVYVLHYFYGLTRQSASIASRAMQNTARGKALQTALSLAAWEQRHVGTIRPEFVHLLDDALQVSGGVGMEYRAVLAERRPLLEAVVPIWLETNSTALFRDGDACRDAFDLTTMYSRPTPWFYRHFRDDLFAEARRRTGRAVAWLLVGILNRIEDYTASAIIDGLRSDATRWPPPPTRWPSSSRTDPTPPRSRPPSTFGKP